MSGGSQTGSHWPCGLGAVASFDVAVVGPDDRLAQMLDFLDRVPQR
jgi:hypothetical protein